MAATVRGVRRWTMPALILLLCATAAGGYWLSETALTAQAESRSLLIPEDALDLGTVWSQELTWELPVHNPTREPLELIGFQSECSCTTVDFESRVIAPGDTVKVALRVDLTDGRLFPTDEAVQPFDVGLAPIVRGSPAALRGLSLLFGVGAAALVWLSVRRALGEERGARGAAAFAAALFVLSPLQIESATTARMYSMGAFFAALTAWLLLHALDARRKPLVCWTAYGLAAAAFCYTHNFAFFTLLSQAVFVAIVSAGAATRASRAPLPPWLGFPFAAALAAALYSPWLPAFRRQSAAVLREFWIPEVTLSEASRILLAWTGGGQVGSVGVSEALWLTALAAVAALVVWRRPRAAGFFLLQAIVPWAMCLAVSLGGGQSILQDRYLAFAQVGLLCLWGVAWGGLRSWLARAALACLLGGAALPAAIDQTSRLVEPEHAALPALRYLAEQYRPGDLVMVSDARQVNRVRYYARKYGFEPADVRCAVHAATGPGHIGNHLASLNTDDVLPRAEELALRRGRIWRIVEAGGVPPPPPGYRFVHAETFHGVRQSRCTVELYEKTKASDRVPDPDTGGR